MRGGVAWDRMQRVRVPELMDDPEVGREDLDQALAYIRVVNRRFGGTEALLRRLKEWSVQWPKSGEGTVTLLDIATGSADVPVAAVRWARGAGFDLRVTGVDIHETTLDLAREHVRANGDVADAITLERRDALRLMDEFAPGSFDYVHAGLFLHHLPEIEVLTVLRIMERLARRGIVWNDLARNPLAIAAVHLLTIGKPRIVRHDARVSVRAGFTRREALDFARRLDLTYARYRLDVQTQRFTLAGEKPDAWAHQSPAELGVP